MKFFEKYPTLNQPTNLANMVEKNLYATMALEDQKISKTKIKKIVAELIRKKSKGDKVFSY